MLFRSVTAQRGTAAVEGEIKRGLAYMYPNVSIPNPLKTHVQIWPAAWYFVRAGSPYSNADIAQWALKPIKNEDISLVGDSYNPQRAGWSDAAYKSSINTLNTNYGLNLPLATMTVNGALAPETPSQPAPRGKALGTMR